MNQKKYKAFISYSHADEAAASWLQRSLENFRAPDGLAQKAAAAGGSARLAPVFRDREDLPVADDLNAAIKAALSDSAFQIVLCSPNSARSKWVNEEIKLFHRLHGPGRVFALIIAGEPGASSMAGREDEECFPPALRFRLDADGALTDEPAEPLAADARERGDGKRNALLKVAAGMLGVGLDDLVQRDAQRRARIARRVAAGSLALMMAASALAFYALAKGREARKMRGEAENLIQYMLTDLKDRLQPVGRLDILESVGERVLDYYADQPASSLDDDALARRAKALQQLGEIDFYRNDLDDAHAAYRSAEATTAELLRRSPNNPDRIFDHAQNVFYVGEAAKAEGDDGAHHQKLQEYYRLAKRLEEIEGDTPRARLEIAYATNNLGVLKFGEGAYEKSIDYFKASIEERQRLLEAAPGDERRIIDCAMAVSWLAHAELTRGNVKEALRQLRRQLEIYGDLAGPDSQNFAALGAAVTAERRIAEAYAGAGDLDAADAAADKALATAARLRARDDKNAIWAINAVHLERLKGRIAWTRGDNADAIARFDRSIEILQPSLKPGAPFQGYAALGYSLASRLLAGGTLEGSGYDEARLVALSDEAIKANTLEWAPLIAIIAIARSETARAAGNPETADTIIDKALLTLTPVIERADAATLNNYAYLAREAGKPDLADKASAPIDAFGYTSIAIAGLEPESSARR